MRDAARVGMQAMQQGAGIDINKLEGIVAALARNDVPPCSAQAVRSRIRETVLHRSNRPRRGGCSGGKPQEPSRIHSRSYQQSSGFYRLAILQQSHDQQRDSLSLRWREQGLREPGAEEMRSWGRGHRRARRGGASERRTRRGEQWLRAMH